MKVEEIRILSKKRKQSQKVGGGGGGGGGGGNGGVMSKLAVNGKAAKRALSPADHASPGGAAPSLSKSSSTGGGSGGGGGAGSSKDTKDASRRRFVWSVPLHQDFVAAVFDVGLKCASPKLLLEMMPVVDGLTSEHIKSHLQKYRLHRQRSREEFLKSYNYLTDLDGGKGLGGGSAAATVAKAAAAAAGGGGGGGGGGDSKPSFPGCGPPNPEPAGCGSSCDCNGGGTGGGAGSLASEDGSGEAPAKPFGSSSGAGKSEGSERSRGGTTEAVGASLGKAAAGDAVSGTLLLSHLELLAKGIDMQVQFHNHLRDVVESQQQLHAQLAGRQGNGRVHNGPAPEGTGDVLGTAQTSSAGMVSPPAVGFSSPTDQQQGVGGGVRVKELKQMQREVRLVVGAGGAGGSLAGFRPLSGPQQQHQQQQQQQASAATAAGGLGWRIAGMHKPNGSSAAADPRESASASEMLRRRGGSAGLNRADGVTAMTPPAPAPAQRQAADASAESVSRPQRDAADHHSSLRVDGTGEAGNTQRQHHQPQPRQQQQQHVYQQFNPTAMAMREALSVQAGAGGVFLPQGLLSMDRHAAAAASSSSSSAGVGSRGYVPGDYTMSSKTSETGGGASSGNPQIAHAQAALFGLGGDGQVRGAHGSPALAARSPAEARAALVAAGLAAPIPTTGAAGAAGGQQEALALQKHMQAQMSMQQSMLSACNDQATSVGQGAWCGGGGMASVLGGGEGAAGASAHRSGTSGGGRAEARKEGGGGGGGGAGAGAGDGGASVGMGIKEQRLDTLQLHPGDAGDSSSMIGMGLLHQDDMFDFGMLDREAELKPGENPADPPPPARPSGDEQSLFSFLMD